jgi:hypothetical protein
MARQFPSSYHWTPTAQRRFLAVLARTGSVGRGCASVAKSRQAAYAFRRRAGSGDFATGWDAALILAQQWLADVMMGYAFSSIAEHGVRHPETRRLMWRRSDPMLGPGMGMTLLLRLDQAVEPIHADPERVARAKAAMEDFNAFLDTIAPGGEVWEMQPFYCQLAQNSGPFTGRPLRASNG